MTKLIVSYCDEAIREKILKGISSVVEIKKISKAYRKGEFSRIYIDIE